MTAALSSPYPVRMVYTVPMRRIQLYMDKDTDEALTAEAARLGTSRSALARRAIQSSLTYFGETADAADELIGCLDIDPGDSDIDTVVYRLDR